MKFFIKDFFSKCDQIRRFLWIWSHLIMKSLTENFIFCAVVRPKGTSYSYFLFFLHGFMYSYVLTEIILTPAI